MPKQNEINLKCNIVLSCGKTISEQEWLSLPQVFAYEKNTATVDRYAIESDPNYYAKLRAERRFQRITKRKQQP